MGDLLFWRATIALANCSLERSDIETRIDCAVKLLDAIDNYQLEDLRNSRSIAYTTTEGSLLG
jgi:hypothetical protein